MGINGRYFPAACRVGFIASTAFLTARCHAPIRTEIFCRNRQFSEKYRQLNVQIGNWQKRTGGEKFTELEIHFRGQVHLEYLTEK